jgi:hypothetical protein
MLTVVIHQCSKAPIDKIHSLNIYSTNFSCELHISAYGFSGCQQSHVILIEFMQWYDKWLLYTAPVISVLLLYEFSRHVEMKCIDNKALSNH